MLADIRVAFIMLIIYHKIYFLSLRKQYLNEEIFIFILLCIYGPMKKLSVLLVLKYMHKL